MIVQRCGKNIYHTSPHEKYFSKILKYQRAGARRNWGWVFFERYVATHSLYFCVGFCGNVFLQKNIFFKNSFCARALHILLKYLLFSYFTVLFLLLHKFVVCILQSCCLHFTRFTDAKYKHIHHKKHAIKMLLAKTGN